MTRTTSRTRTDPAGAAGRVAACLAIALIVVSCTPADKRAGPPASDVPNGAALASEAAGILLAFAAYDYALAGALSGERTNTVSPERYAAVARGSIRRVNGFGVATVAAAATSAG
ncbi:MAG: hypothetical protein ACRDF0_11280, partial [Candidatus Limnocylindria bacterium]